MCVCLVNWRPAINLKTWKASLISFSLSASMLNQHILQTLSSLCLLTRSLPYSYQCHNLDSTAPSQGSCNHLLISLSVYRIVSLDHSLQNISSNLFRVQFWPDHFSAGKKRKTSVILTTHRDWGFPDDSVVKNPAMQEIQVWVRSLGQEDPLEESMATHSSILVRKIPSTEEPGGLWKELDTTEVTVHAHPQRVFNSVAGTQNPLKLVLSVSVIFLSIISTHSKIENNKKTLQSVCNSLYFMFYLINTQHSMLSEVLVLTFSNSTIIFKDGLDVNLLGRLFWGPGAEKVSLYWFPLLFCS